MKQCTQCEAQFETSGSLSQHLHDKHKVETKTIPKKKIRKMFVWLVTVALLALAVYGLTQLTFEKPYARNIHWHALLDIQICGEKRNLPLSKGGNTVHGQSFLGEPLIHTHDDNVIHVEGTVLKPEDISLGTFFDAIEVPFSETQLFEKKNGDVCAGGTDKMTNTTATGKPGAVKMFVNSKPSTEFRNYGIKPTEDGKQQVVKIVFE